MSKPFALQLYSVRDLYREDFAKCVESVARLGYQGVECFGEPTLPAETVKAALEQNHLTLVGWHLGIELLEDGALDGTIAYLKAVGCPIAIVPYFEPAAFQSAESTLALAHRLSAIQKALAPHGIAFGYHNHSAEFIPFPDGTLPWALLMDHTDIIGQLDNGNALSSRTPGLDIPAFVRRWPGRARTVHAKPFSAQNEYACMIGEDDIDWPAFLKAAREAGKAEWIIVEFEDDAFCPQLEGVERCLRAIEKY